MKIRSALYAATALVGVFVAALVVAIGWGGPTPLKPMRSISDPFKDVDFTTLPVISRYPARDGAQLAYRLYPPASGQPARGSVVLIHGSAANSQSMHPLAQSYALAGFTVYALDMRGHGESGPRGDIAYVGQLDDDLQDFMQAERPARPKTLVGFSAGGGFAIRVAGGARQALFDNYLFLAPFINRRAANYRPAGGGWVSIGVPRLIAIALLNRIGVTSFNHLPVTNFAIDESPRAQVTNSYTYALSINFQPRADYNRNLRNIREPAEVVDGRDDEIFIADKLAQVFADAGRSDIPVTLVPDTDHVMLSLSPVARTADVSAVERLDSATSLVRQGAPQMAKAGSTHPTLRN